ncbi:hypothetical protein EJ02DRAFT_454655 [Clathrospora elynae]|uniref:Uncharacterized protein n=1 Tax=Clathrospora elynae TaxID=706981 RepID=A0A6A5SR10_9PLEO|nr:hypothetical protein EJ02DRAFT_454655 [Clathrospora elynae]
MVKTFPDVQNTAKRDRIAVGGRDGDFQGVNDAKMKAITTKLEAIVADAEVCRQKVLSTEFELAEQTAAANEIQLTAGCELAQAQLPNADTKQIRRLHVQQAILGPDLFPEGHSVATQTFNASNEQREKEIRYSAWLDATDALVVRGDDMERKRQAICTT